MKTFETNTAATFQQWLEPQRILAMAVTATQIAISDAEDDEVWTVHPDIAEPFLRAVQASGRKVWVSDGTTIALRFARKYSFPLGELLWLLDADTANNTAFPLALVKDRMAKRSLGAVREAQALAKVMVAMREALQPQTMTAVMSSVRQEQLWREAQLRGWRVDTDMLEAEIVAVEVNRAKNIAEYGIDLTGYGPKAAERIHAWLGAAGILIIDPKTKKPSLSRRLFDEVDIPDTEEAKAAWKQFRTARSIYSRAAKLYEIKRAMKDGRVYSHFVIRDTLTGRATSSKPALQNLHRDLRSLLIADTGMVLTSLDFSQMEPYVGAALSKDQALLAGLASGDVYYALSKQLFSDAVNADGTMHAERRGLAKTYLLGVFYGKKARRFARELGVTVDEAQTVLDGIWATYPELAAFSASLVDLHKRGELLFTTNGRPSPKPPAGEHASLNNLVQGEAADVFVDAVARVAEVVGRENLFLGVHDELILQVPSNSSSWALAVLNAKMPVDFHGVHLPGEAQVLGRAWKK